MYIRLLNYLPRYRDGSGTDNAIDWWTVIWNTIILLCPRKRNWLAPFKKETYSLIRVLWILRCSHSEIWTPGLSWDAGKCWTSTMRGEFDGVRVADAMDVIENRYRWTYFNIPVDDNIYPSLLRSMQVDVDNNTGYGKIKIASFFTPWRFGKKPICSEKCCSWIIQGTSSIRLMYQLLPLKAPSPLIWDGVFL